MSVQNLDQITDWREIAKDDGEVVIGEVIGEGVSYKPHESLRRHQKGRKNQRDPFGLARVFSHSILGLS